MDHTRLEVIRFWALTLAAAGASVGAAPGVQADGAQVAIAFVRDSGKSAVQAFDVNAPWPALTPALTVDAAPRLLYADGKLYVLSREADTLAVVDADSWTLLQSFALGPSSRPVDLAVRNDVAYITRELGTRLLRLDLRNGEMTEPVDFAPMADADGVPDLGSVLRDGDRLFVQVRRLNENELEFFERPAYIAVVDLSSESLIDVDPLAAGPQGIALQGTAPLHRMQIGPRPERLFVSASWNTHNVEGGIEMIDLKSLTSLGIVAAEVDPVSGVCCDMAPFVMVSTSHGYFTFSTDSTLSSHLHRFSIDGGIDPEDLYTSLGYEAANHVYDFGTDHLFVPTVEDVPGFQVFDATTGERLSQSIIPVPGLISDLVLICACGDPMCDLEMQCPGVPADSRWSLAALILALGLLGLVRARSAAS